jgi:hypothetical protein
MKPIQAAARPEDVFYPGFGLAPDYVLCLADSQDNGWQQFLLPGLPPSGNTVQIEHSRQ